MFTGKRKRDKEFSMNQGNLNDPDALAFFYMDNMLCYEHHLKYDDCMQEYEKKWVLSPWRRKLHRECLSHLDMYKACIIG